MAIGSDQSLNIVIRLKDEASKQLDAFKGKLDDMQPAFRKTAAIGGAALAGITTVAFKSVQAYGEAERGNRQLENAVINVSKGTMDQVQAISNVTDELQKKAGIDGDALKIGAAQLSTFGLQSQSVVDLTKSLADLTVNQSGLNSTSDDYITSANVMAKALQGQFGLLEKSGIRFTEAQQKAIEFGTESEKVAALQEGLAQNLRETTDTVGGVDLAMAKMSTTAGEIQENVGRALAPAFAELTAKLLSVIEKFSTWAQENPKLLSTLLLVGGALAGVATAIGIIGIALPAIIAGFTFLLSPVGLVIIAIAALTAGIIWLVKNWDIVKEKMSSVWASIKSAFKEGVNFVIGLAKGMANMWVKAVNTIIGALNKIKVSIPSWVPGIGGKSFGINLPTVPEVSLPRLEHGGIVNGPRGTEVPIIAHGQERIIPANQASKGMGGGNTYQVIINNPQILNQQQSEFFAEQIEKALRDVTRSHRLTTI